MMGDRIQLRRGSEAFWESENTILFPGEPGVEMLNGHPSRMKIGDGKTPWNELQYSPASLSTPDVELVAELIADHISDPTPHPVYDNGPALYLLYQNAKV